MSQRPKTVDHIGEIQEIAPNNVLVRISSHTACSGCHVSGVCGMADSAEKIIDVYKPNHSLTIGQDVRVVLKQSHGYKAVLMGYVIPFVVVLASLIVLTSLNIPEGQAGLISLATLIPYYVGLFLTKDKISKQISFDIETI